jgi:ribose/xylose/arabinose/galactoside ABC-type transport system permease subunit
MTIHGSKEIVTPAGLQTRFVARLESLAAHNSALLGLLALLVAVAVAGDIISGGTALRPENIQNVLQQNSQLLVVVTAQFLVVATGGIDLSVGAVLALSSIVFVGFLGYGPVLATFTAICAGAIFGAVNGMLVTLVRLPAFIVTLGTMQIGYSLARLYTGGGTTAGTSMETPMPPAMLEFYAGRFLGLPLPMWLAVFVLIAVTLYLRTSIGHFIFAVGGNSRAARLAGIANARVRIAAYTAASAIAAVAGIVFAMRVGYGDPQAGLWMPLDSIAAVSIGGVSLTGGRGTAPSGFLGVLIIAVVDNVMNLIGVPVTLQPVVKGAILIVTVLAYNLRRS